ncbi:hypothetical protein [Amycolatopsis rhizosphaerae]|uniref:hypothetical protein n=1 Tax=Amycolatopsis rhizosphaerae TaxID=2053003 RepID=UPI001643D638|nr:hypothetical protein [Amycolatopsis rhizosphaerae]
MVATEVPGEHGALGALAGRLLIQCRPAQAGIAAEVAAAYDAGLVLTGKEPEPAVRGLRRAGFTGPVLCDADRYSGPGRKNAARGIRPGWCRRQQDLGLVALTDSGYLEARNLQGLRTILRAAARQPPPALAVLPLAARWFATTAIAGALVREIAVHGVPVAVAVESRGDPFAVQYVVRNFLYLLRESPVPVVLLRSDVGALGALCHGALAAAIGTVSALRHLYPVTRGQGGRPPRAAAFVTPLLAYHALDTLDEVIGALPEFDHLWRCECPVCDGRTPAALAGLPDETTAAFRHSLHAQFRLRADLLRPKATREALASTWHEHCSHALSLHQELAERLPRRRPPAALASWLAASTDPIRDGAPIPRQEAPAAARPPSRPQDSPKNLARD